MNFEISRVDYVSKIVFLWIWLMINGIIGLERSRLGCCQNLDILET